MELTLRILGEMLEVCSSQIRLRLDLDWKLKAHEFSFYG